MFFQLIIWILTLLLEEDEPQLAKYKKSSVTAS